MDTETGFGESETSCDLLDSGDMRAVAIQGRCVHQRWEGGITGISLIPSPSPDFRILVEAIECSHGMQSRRCFGPIN